MTEEREPLTITDSEGEVREQRKIEINTSAPKRRPGRPRKSGPKEGKTMKVFNKINAKIFLHDGRTLGPMEEGVITQEDYALQTIKDRVIVMA